MTVLAISIKKFFSPQRYLELAASIVTLTGQALGSTSLHGAICYAFASVLWIWLTVYLRMWGLMPLNLAGAVVTVWTLWRLLT
jgi:hypothetical protein